MAFHLSSIVENGTFYPFAVTMDSNQELSLMGYTGDRDQVPEPEKFALELYRQIRSQIELEGHIISAAIFKLQSVEAEVNGVETMLTGVGVTIDHQNGRPLLIFFPFVEDASGKHTLVDEMTFSSQEPFFDNREPVQD